jgi:S1-C subfamily serine protease
MTAMRKMLAISLLLCGTAWAAPPPDRSALSYEENVVINTACAAAVPKGASAFNACVAKQLAALKEHPSPDRSGLSPSRNRAVEGVCHYLLRDGVGPYNDCIAKAMAGPALPGEDKVEDELSPHYATFFNDADAEPKLDVAKPLPSPGEMLPRRPNEIATKRLDPKVLYQKVVRSVYVIIATQSLAEARMQSFNAGSAVAVSDHLLLTNCHVVKDRPLIKVVREGTLRGNATLVAADFDTDRCVLKSDGAPLTPITAVRTLASLAVGEHVYAIGAPRLQEHTMSEGLISAIRLGNNRNLVQTSAAISPGSSGGGLFDDRGNLVGITTLGSNALAQNLNFAIAAADWWKAQVAAPRPVPDSAPHNG